MRPDEMDAIERACEAATPGPWFWVSYKGRDTHMRAAPPDYDSDGEYASADDRRRADAGDIITTDSGVYGPNAKDRPFIAGARSWVPALVAEVRRLRQVEANLRESLALGEARWASYQEDVDETNRLLDEAGLHVGSNDLATLVRQLIADAGRTRPRDA